MIGPGPYPKPKKQATLLGSFNEQRNPRSITGGTLAPSFRDRTLPRKQSDDTSDLASKQDDAGAAAQQLARKLASSYSKRQILRRPTRPG